MKPQLSEPPFKATERLTFVDHPCDQAKSGVLDFILYKNLGKSASYSMSLQASLRNPSELTIL